jgi:hypothetical protein
MERLLREEAKIDAARERCANSKPKNDAERSSPVSGDTASANRSMPMRLARDAAEIYFSSMARLCKAAVEPSTPMSLPAAT